MWAAQHEYGRGFVRGLYASFVALWENRSVRLLEKNYVCRLTPALAGRRTACRSKMLPPEIPVLPN